LLLTTGIAIGLPFLQLNLVAKNSKWTDNLKPIIIESSNLRKNLSIHIENNYASIIIVIYLIPLIFILGMFMVKVYTIYKTIHTNTIIKHQNVKIILLNNKHEVYTFINYIFIDENLYKNKDLSVVEHELIHINDKHWVDLLLFEILKIIFWFNPFVWIYQKEISYLHEFIADKNILHSTDFKQYFNKVLQEKFKTYNVSFVNQFFQANLIKKRIRMQKKKHSKPLAKIKYAFSIILLIGLTLIVDSCNQKQIDKQVAKILIHTDNNNSVSFNSIVESPVFPGCENAKDKKKCFRNKINEYIVQNFNNTLIDKQNERIIAQFTVNNNGKIINIKARAKNNKLVDETIRLISHLPEMIPGKQANHNVKVVYTLPIVIKN
jgi:beta-lactamase regulating signal transducer with metallopeptidase domain